VTGAPILLSHGRPGEAPAGGSRGSGPGAGPSPASRAGATSSARLAAYSLPSTSETRLRTVFSGDVWLPSLGTGLAALGPAWAGVIVLRMRDRAWIDA
jgi:hypothetical protein